QWPSRQQATVASEAIVLNNDFGIPGELEMLQAVIGHNDVDMRVRRQERLDSLTPSGVHCHGGLSVACHEHRFIANLACSRCFGDDPGSMPKCCAVTSANDAGSPAACLQGSDERHDYRGLPGATGKDVANDHNRYARVVT